MSTQQIQKKHKVAVIGGGAAGYFTAITCAEANPNYDVHLLEGTRRTLTKVRISGGGRCNVTHACFEPKELVGHYPRGHKELLGPFHRFRTQDTIDWFAQRGVELKREDDGRMFPTTDSSETIARCLEEAAARAGVTLHLGHIVNAVRQQGTQFILITKAGETVYDNVILATGSAPSGHHIAQALGHTIVAPVPSLFTFNINDPRLVDQAGISFPKATLTLQIGTHTFKQTGPLLITHWGLSGPAVLKLSAWAARELHASTYRARLTINFMANVNAAAVRERLLDFKQKHAKKMLATESPVDVPRRFWQQLVAIKVNAPGLTWADTSLVAIADLATEVSAATYEVAGKGVFKEEFVTAGGVSLRDVDFRTMESKIVPGLFFAGEILDIDGVTGGFNFQNAWTSGWTAGSSLRNSLR